MSEYISLVPVEPITVFEFAVSAPILTSVDSLSGVSKSVLASSEPFITHNENLLPILLNLTKLTALCFKYFIPFVLRNSVVPVSYTHLRAHET